MHPVLANALSGFSDSLRLMFCSAASFMLANVMPEESLLKLASGITGWVLAVSTIYVLVKTVRVLFAKLEAKDDLLRAMLEKQRDDLQKELDSHDNHGR
jgi:hypothetical protein